MTFHVTVVTQYSTDVFFLKSLQQLAFVAGLLPVGDFSQHYSTLFFLDAGKVFCHAEILSAYCKRHDYAVEMLNFIACISEIVLKSLGNVSFHIKACLLADWRGYPENTVDLLLLSVKQIDTLCFLQRLSVSKLIRLTCYILSLRFSFRLILTMEDRSKRIK